VKKTALTEVCFKKLSKEMNLQRVPGFEDIESVKLASGEEGGGIKVYKGEKIDKLVLVDFKFEKGVPIPSYENRTGIGAELFVIIPDFSYKMPMWGINSVILKDGTYTFDTDFSFGFDLVMDYEFTMKYLDPFNEIYKKFSNHKDLKRVFLDKTTTWVRTYISPVFIIAETRVEKVDTVYELCSEFIKLWIKICKEAEKKDQAFRESQQKRINSQNAGMKDTDRIGKVLFELYGKETFSKFFKVVT
jgi:hypothetical protein